jgi:P-type Mg2+ transporter
VIESALFAVALAVGRSPELLPAIVSGTLTEGTIVLDDALDVGNRPSDEVRRLAFLNAAFEARIQNPLDAAIVAAGKGAGLTTHGFAKIDEIPYGFFVAGSHAEA